MDFQLLHFCGFEYDWIVVMNDEKGSIRKEAVVA
jgi:hypothetical protein